MKGRFACLLVLLLLPLRELVRIQFPPLNHILIQSSHKSGWALVLIVFIILILVLIVAFLLLCNGGLKGTLYLCQSI